MSKKPKLVYSLASAGMGHATRAIPILDRLSKDYEIHIFCSGNANKWLGKQYAHLHQNHAIKAVKSGGQVNITLVVLKALTQLPKTLFYTFRIALFILINRPKAVISDFELHSIYGAKLAGFFYKVPIISCDHWTTMYLSDCPFRFSADEEIQFNKWKKTIKLVSSKADTYLIHGTMKTQLKDESAVYVPTPVRDSFLQAGEKITYDGPIVVSTGHLQDENMIKELKKSSYNFVIFGTAEPRTDQNIQYKLFDEDEFIKSLQASPFVIVSANSSAIDSLAINKPLLYIPNPGQFEQFYCGKMFEYLGVAKVVTHLNADIIEQFINKLSSYKENISKLDIFDNDRLCEEIKKRI